MPDEPGPRSTADRISAALDAEFGEAEESATHEALARMNVPDLSPEEVDDVSEETQEDAPETEGDVDE